MKFRSIILLIIGYQTAFGQYFTKVTDSPVSTTPGDSRSVNWVDVNGDGYVDCFISNGPQAGQNNMLYINDTHGQFTAVSDDPVVQDQAPSDGATFADIDNDGDLDGFVVNWYNRNNLAYINDGNGHFTQVTEGLWVNHAGYSETAAFGDYNQDGRVDLYVTNSAGQKKNFLYLNQGPEQMESQTGISPVTDAHSSRSVNWTDIDLDGDLDLFVTNENGEKDDMYRNDGNGAFEKITTSVITQDAFSTMSSSWGDIDNDGDLDLFLANDGSKNQLFRNDGDFVFARIETTDISKNTANSFSSAWGDIDNDGDLDLFVTNAFKNGVRLKNNLYLNDGEGHFSEVTTDVATMDQGWSYGCAFGDYDHDGFLDLAVATTRFGGVDDPDYLYHNTGNENHWIMISLEGQTSDRSAIGAKVRVKATVNGKDIWQLREISSQSAYCSQNDMRAHFGLGDATLIDSIVIEWPSGIQQVRTDVTADQILQIDEEGTSAVHPGLPSFALNVFPNPTHSGLQIIADVGTQPHDILLEVFGDTGLLVHRESYRNVSGHWQEHLELKKLQLMPGSYVVRVRHGVSVVERKVIFVQ